jgi:hypothetical protein
MAKGWVLLDLRRLKLSTGDPYRQCSFADIWRSSVGGCLGETKFLTGARARWKRKDLHRKDWTVDSSEKHSRSMLTFWLAP